MINLKFKGGAEFVIIEVYRKERNLFFASSKTNYDKVKLPFEQLFDKGKEKEQDEETKNLTDEEFTARIIEEMKKQGYTI